MKHEVSQAHKQSVIAQALFLRGSSLYHSLKGQENQSMQARKQEVDSNRNILTRIIDVLIFIGCPGLPL